jgi:plastocyanin
MEPAVTSTKSRRRRALAPALTLLITAAVVAGAGVAGAKESTTIYISESGGQCFTLEPGNPPCGAKPAVTIQTGDTVTWNFDGGTGIGHNAADGDRPFGQERYRSDFKTSGTYSYTFGVAGTYKFVCQAHTPAMEGTITVEGEPVETSPTATATASPTPSATTPAPTPTATVQAAASTDDHLQTPAPGRGAKDKVAPKVRTMRLRARARQLDVRYWLSEPATVTITATRRGSKTKLASTTVQSPAGTRTVKLRNKRITGGTYTVALRVTDAMGNKTRAAGKNVRLRRAR